MRTNCLSNYLSKCAILADNQYGLRSRSDIDMAAMEMVDKIREAFRIYEYAIRIVTDLSMAFDTLNHCILCNKLEHYGIMVIALHWLPPYLNNRPVCGIQWRYILKIKAEM